MVLYLLWWLRYFRSERTLHDFYGSFCGVPVAGAVLPVAAFLLLGIYGKVLWLAGSALVLGVGHIGIHLRHRAPARGASPYGAASVKRYAPPSGRRTAALRMHRNGKPPAGSIARRRFTFL